MTKLAQTNSVKSLNLVLTKFMHIKVVTTTKLRESKYFNRLFQSLCGALTMVASNTLFYLQYCTHLRVVKAFLSVEDGSTAIRTSSPQYICINMSMQLLTNKDINTVL